SLGMAVIAYRRLQPGASPPGDGRSAGDRSIWCPLMSRLSASFEPLRGWASAPDFVSRAVSVSYASNRRRYLRTIALVLVLELVVALPFTVVSPSSMRGVPGPLLIVISLAGCFLLGLRAGVPLVTLSVILGIEIVHESEIASPLVWIPMAFVVGWLGDEVRRGEALRRSLVTEL